jgi:hypothetical protein
MGQSDCSGRTKRADAFAIGFLLISGKMVFRQTPKHCAGRGNRIPARALEKRGPQDSASIDDVPCSKDRTRLEWASPD